jgi:hypothetical protein
MTIITHEKLPDWPYGDGMHLYTPDGEYIGAITIDGKKGTSRIEYPEGTPPHQPIRLKKKYRAGQ